LAPGNDHNPPSVTMASTRPAFSAAIASSGVLMIGSSRALKEVLIGTGRPVRAL
jgi:hypothetical protein